MNVYSKRICLTESGENSGPVTHIEALSFKQLQPRDKQRFWGVKYSQLI